MATHPAVRCARVSGTSQSHVSTDDVIILCTSILTAEKIYSDISMLNVFGASESVSAVVSNN